MAPHHGRVPTQTPPTATETAKKESRTVELNNLKQVGLALHNYHGVHGQFPPLPVRPGRNADPNVLLGWMVLILPQLDQDGLYKASEQACLSDPNPLHNPPHLGLATVVRPYACPADGRLSTPLTDVYGVTASYTSYIGITGTLPPGARVGLDGVLGDNRATRLAQITDGTSQTIMVGERPPPASLQAGWWYSGYVAHVQGHRGPNNSFVLGGGTFYPSDPCVVGKGTFGPGRLDNPCDRFHLWSLHSGGANFLFADASARYLPYSAEPLMMALGSRSGGEIVELP